MKDGTQQGQRALEVMESRRFPVDATPLDQLVALCERLSRHVRYVDLNNHDSGTWEGLFERDESLVLAGIASFDHHAWRQDFIKHCDTQATDSLVDAIIDLATRIDGWWSSLSLSGMVAAKVVCEAIEQLVRRRLNGQLSLMLHALEEAPRKRADTRLDQARLSPSLWGKLLPPAGEQSLPPQTRQTLRGLGFTFLNAATRIQLLARERLQDTLDSGAHEAAPGLLLAFLRLYGTVQQQVNTFAGKHIDFYYRRVLGLSEQAARPDSTYLACLPDPRFPGQAEVPAGTLFNAGKDAAGHPILFRSLEGLALSDARVASLATIRQLRDDKIWPEASMGYVTTVRQTLLGVPGPQADAVPMFGGGPRSSEAALGLALASPLLFLKEGERTIDLELRLAWPKPTRRMLQQLVRQAVKQTDAAAFRRALGQVFACWLLGDGVGEGANLWPWQKDQLRRRAAELNVSLGQVGEGNVRGADPPSLLRMCGDETDARERVFDKVIDELFDVSLTHVEGWLTIERLQFSLPQRGSGGLHLRVFLRPEDPPIVACNPKVHGEAWRNSLPVLRLLVSPRAGIHPCSLFADAHFVRAELAVAVNRVRDLMLHNQLGLLDASKSFAPFGPLPTTASYLVVASPEAALKTLDTMSLNLRWSGLPDDPGGFASYYADYGYEQSHTPFTAELCFLRAGEWWPCTGASANQPLFAAVGPDERLRSDYSFDVDAGSVQQYASASSQPLTSTFAARDGLLRLQLKQPRGAFGHAAYPELLAQAVRSKAWRRGHADMPTLPYTPELETISLDYTARATLPARRERGIGGADEECLMHVHPFGVIELQTDTEHGHYTLLPPLGPDGCLYIGLRAQALQGTLSLLFQLQPAGAEELPDGEEPERPQWACLQDGRWRPLGLRELRSDTTFGLLCSGIVTLDLPEGLRSDQRLLGGGLFWLRVTAARLLNCASPLISVHAQAVTVQRVVSATAVPERALPAGSIGGPDTAVPGLAGVIQVETTSGLQPAETAQHLRTRAGERLRHKNRASLVWDYERLVLEQFPEVFKVRCFTWPEVKRHIERRKGAEERNVPQTGTVLLAVVPRTPRNDPAGATAEPRLDTLTLRRIKEALAQHMSPSANLDVRNAYYERIQARCVVRLDRSAHDGQARRRINTVITQYLSPWFDEGFGPRFDWVLRCDEIETQVRAVPGVVEVAGLSLLHVTRSAPAYYRLGDTAGPRRREGGPVLRHWRPWSLAVPIAEHLITFEPTLDTVRPQVTGLPLLRIGQTFIVGESRVAAPQERP